MNKNGAFFMLVGGILLLLTILLLCFGHMKHECEEGLARNSGSDEQSRQIQDELDQFRHANRNVQLGILATGGIVVVVAAVWWVARRSQESD